MSSLGKQFKKNCDFVHTVADEVIKKRKQTLVCTGIKFANLLNSIRFLLTGAQCTIHATHLFLVR